MLFEFENKGYNCAANTAPSLYAPQHLHQHIEIVLVLDGQADAIVDDNNILLEKGDLLIVFPNQIHAYLDRTEVVLHDLVIASPNYCTDFYGTFYNNIPVNPVIKNASDNPTVILAIEKLIDLCDGDPVYANHEVKAYLYLLYVEIFKHLALTTTSNSHPELLPRVLEYLQQHYTEDVNLNTISEELCASPFYISHIFNERLHTNIRKYINLLRINKARELLTQQNMSITEIAYSIGYNSSKTFNRCFKEITGTTPLEYRSSSRRSKK